MSQRRRALKPLSLASLVLYQLVYLVVFCGYVLWRFLLDARYRRGFGERLGFLPRSSGERPVIWIHGVSVGEVKAAGNLIARLREEHPEFELLISATTPTGHALARQLHPDLRVVYYPFDLGFGPWLALRRIRPACVLLMELEIWPNFLQVAGWLEIPVAVINGRISEQSFRGYRLARAILPQFHLIERYCMQNGTYRQRLLDLQVRAEAIHITGNMKYDNVQLQRVPEGSERLRAWLGPGARPVLVCGSTHGDEDRQLYEVVRAVSAQLQQAVRLVLAPRHPERCAAVIDELTEAGARCLRWSEAQDQRPELVDEVVIVDTIGHLETFYGACDVAFIGGSLVPRGGQNMVEAAALGKAVVFGPHTSNFRKDVQLLREAQAVVQVGDAGELQEVLVRLFGDPAERQALGEAAVAVIADNRGSTERTLESLRPLLSAG